MTKQTIVKILDDLTGEDADETVTFALDGVGYEIDLTSANSSELRELLDRYIAAGTRTGRVGNGAQIRSYGSRTQAAAPSSAASRAENQQIREWANSAGHELADRGRIPQHIVDAYHSRHRAAARLDSEVEQAAKAPARKRTPPAARFAAAS